MKELANFFSYGQLFFLRDSFRNLILCLRHKDFSIKSAYCFANSEVYIIKRKEIGSRNKS